MSKYQAGAGTQPCPSCRQFSKKALGTKLPLRAGVCTDLRFRLPEGRFVSHSKAVE